MRIYSRPEAAKAIGIDYATLTNWIKSGRCQTVVTNEVTGALGVPWAETARLKNEHGEHKMLRGRGQARCRECREIKRESEFLKGRRVCRECLNLARSFQIANWRRYGLTETQYTKLLKSQKGKCAICRKPETESRLGKVKPLCIDHDHKTGKVRALLCHSCNRKLGVLENRKFVRAAEKYLARFREDENE